MKNRTLLYAAVIGALLLATQVVVVPAADPPAKPAEISITTAPDPVTPGGEARVTVELEPISGVKINRYPKIKLEIPETEGLVGAHRAAIGNDKPPAPDKMKDNYFDEIDPLVLTLTLEPGAPAGKHELDGKLTYFYCIPKSGFCAPKRVPVKIPITIH